MKVRVKFKAFNRRYVFNLDTDRLDRNYSDEDYGYWIRERDGRFFEINIDKEWKDENNWTFTNKGVVNVYENLGVFEDGDFCDSLCITFQTYNQSR